MKRLLGTLALALVVALPLAKVRVAVIHAENVVTLTEVTGTIRPVQRAQIAAQAGVDMIEIGTWDIEAARAANAAKLK